MGRFLGMLAILLLLAACAPQPPAVDTRELPPQEERGRRIYQFHCGACHHATRPQPLHGPPLAGLFRRQYMPSGIPATEERVREAILSGRPNMPPFRNILSEEQLADLMAYLRTL